MLAGMLRAMRELLTRVSATLVSKLGTTKLAVVVFSFAVPLMGFVLKVIPDLIQRKHGVSMLQVVEGSLLSWTTLVAVGTPLITWIVLLVGRFVKQLSVIWTGLNS
jgi:hypothetical protein